MRCNLCGTENAEGSKFCTSCGASLESNVTPTAPVYQQPVQQPVQQPTQQYAQPMQSAPVYQQPVQQYNQVPATMTKEEFLALPAMAKDKKNLKACYIICYVCAAITLVAQLAGGSFPLDAIILAVLGVIIQLKNSFVASVILLAYSIFNFLVCIFALHTVGGWLIIAAGVYAVITTSRVMILLHV